MVDIFNSQVELVLVSLPVTAVLGAPVRQDTQQSDVMFVIPWHYAVVKEFGGHQGLSTCYYYLYPSALIGWYQQTSIYLASSPLK
jgi:hypothetical protein